MMLVGTRSMGVVVVVVTATALAVVPPHRSSSMLVCHYSSVIYSYIYIKYERYCCFTESYTFVESNDMPVQTGGNPTMLLCCREQFEYRYEHVICFSF